MKIRDVKPGETVKIAEGPAKGREVKVIIKTTDGGSWVGVRGTGPDVPGQNVRGDLEVES